MNDTKALGVRMKSMRMQAVFLILLVKRKSLGNRVLQEDPGCMADAEGGPCLLRAWDHF